MIHRPGRARSWLRRAHRSDGGVRLLCLPYAGAGASAFHSWAEHAGAGLELWLGLLPGREGRIAEPPATCVEELAEGLAGALAELDERPLAIFGHSFGALVGYELVRALRRRGGPTPRHLFVSGMVAPQLLVPGPPLTDGEILDELRAMGATPEPVLSHPELMELVMPALRADFHAVQRYAWRAEPPIALPITSLGGLDDPSVSEAALAAWQVQTRGPFTSRRWPGRHHYLHDVTAELVAMIAGALGVAGGR
jgi:surfactin synthase thioesterase subunit